MGVHFDPNTIESIGRQVLAEEINRIKQSPRKQDSNQEEEDYYGSDFENVDESPSPEIRLGPQIGGTDSLRILSPRVKTPPPLEINRQEPEVRPRAPEPRPKEPEPIQPVERPGSIQDLLNPYVLAKMSPAAVQHYIQALVESGHISKDSQPTKIEVPRQEPIKPVEIPQQIPVPPAAQMPTVQQIIRNEIPDELRYFFDSEIGLRLKEMINTEKDQLTAKQILEKFINTYLKPPTQGVPLIDIQHEGGFSSIEKEVFPIPKPSVKPGFNIEAEEQKIRHENATARKLFEIPLFDTQEFATTPILQDYGYESSEASYSSKSSTIGSDIFAVDNPEFIGGFIDYVKRAQELEEGQIPGEYELSEGEVHMGDVGMESGEIPADIFRLSYPSIPSIRASGERIRISGSGLLLDDEYDRSEGEVDPSSIFNV